jgi:hypothetical protein
MSDELFQICQEKILYAVEKFLTDGGDANIDV